VLLQFLEGLAVEVDVIGRHDGFVDAEGGPFPDFDEAD